MSKKLVYSLKGNRLLDSNAIIYNQRRLKQIIDGLMQELSDATATGTSITVNDSANAPAKLLPGGNTLQSNLPLGYTQLDCIESSGTQGIATGITGDCVWEIKAQSTVSSTASQVLISKSVEVGNWFGAIDGKWGSGGTGITNIDETTLADIVLNFSGATISGTVNGESFERIGTISSSAQYRLFSRISYPFSGKLYKAKCTQNNVVVRNFIPCKNPNNEVGLYDLVTKTFFANTEIGNFVAGDVTELIPSPSNEIPIHNVSGHNEFKISNEDDTEYQTAEFTLVEGQKMFEEDYPADDGIHQLWGEVTLDGVNNKVIKNDSNVGSYLYIFSIKHEKIAGYCSHFNHYTGYPSTQSSAGKFNTTQSANVIYFNGYGIVSADNSQLADANEFNSWLQTHNIILQYKLENPVIIPYTELQQVQYNKLKHIMSHFGQTNVNTISAGDEKPMLTFGYKKTNNVHSRLESIENRLALLEG